MSISDNLKDHILDSIGEGVFTVDKNFKINYFNKAAEKITGFKREEVLGKFCKHIFISDLCCSNCPISLVLKAHKKIFDFESRIQGKDGKSRPIKLNSAVLFNENNEPTGGIVTFRDISELDAIRRNLQKQTLYHGIIGHSKQMQEIFDLIDEVAESNAAVFIQGESGTGKEMIANAVQQTSLRKDKPFIKINCSVFSENLLASELFGHVKGAFTDALNDRPGRFELADTGTLFLDEVAEMPWNMQLQLLRVLQEGTFERVGESITRKVNVRVIAATNIDIKDALSKGTIREDLFYRLNVIPILVPPLRERMDDVPPLVKYFLEKYSLLYKKEVKDIEDQALDLLLKYDWPGNVRELENVIEYALVRTGKGDLLQASKLSANIRENLNGKEKYGFDRVMDTKRAEILQLLEKNHWNKSKVAEELGIGRTTLWRKLKNLGLVED